MEELKLEVGQKVWTIQSGDCQLVEIDNNSQYCFITENKDGRGHCYDKFGRYGDEHFSPSLFESNPFEKKVSEPENKAELINALSNVYLNATDIDIKSIARTKLKKLLESL